jgi:hypothetical protein
MDFDEQAFRLENSYSEMLKEQERMRLFEEALIPKIKELINEIYPHEIQNLTAEGYRMLESKVVDHSIMLIQSVEKIMDEKQQ